MPNLREDCFTVGLHCVIINNNNMATNLIIFTSSNDIRRLPHANVERRHLGRQCSETVTGDSGEQGRHRAEPFPP